MRVQLFHLEHTYPPDHKALRGVSLELAEGALTFLTGPSGAGKSTLFRLMFAEERPSSGQVVVGDWPVHRLSYRERARYRRQVGYVFQDLKLLPALSAAENVALPLEAAGLARTAQRARAHERLYEVSLGHALHTPVEQLSGGERQRVAVARALALRPRLLLADEPTGNLDPALSRAVMDLLFEQSLRGCTVVVSTHDLALAARYRARVVEVRGGLVSGDSGP
ncbi:MAG: ATP-binding cassette domain-containing protein [Deltaproteobacteria bacterium]|nr:ATP-binding cassette domain-containing protein [Deltaproteobacteria bacterium]